MFKRQETRDKRQFRKILAVGTLAVTVLTSAIPSTQIMAAEKTININEAGGAFNYQCCGTRSKACSYVRAKCVRVFPSEEKKKDTFESIRVEIFRKKNGKYECINEKNGSKNYYVVSETKGWKKIYLKDNMMKTNYAYFGFVGNSEKSDAIAIVGYDPK